MGAITEMDCWLPDNTTESLRWQVCTHPISNPLVCSTRLQASIFGDLLDSCLFSSNCNEFILWDPRVGTTAVNSVPPCSRSPISGRRILAQRVQHHRRGQSSAHPHPTCYFVSLIYLFCSTWGHSSTVLAIANSRISKACRTLHYGFPPSNCNVVLARLLNFAKGGAEPCSTSSGTSACIV
jgi:hypothetical protein